MDGIHNFKKRSVSTELLLGRPMNCVEAKHYPKVLYTSGSMKIPVPGPRVAIVGTRQASEKGLRDAYRLAYELVKKGVVVVSGLAKGIDSQAHRGAIAGGGNTIAVLGTPLSQFYPKENRDLQLEIMKNQLTVTQFPENRSVQRRNFVIRNRTMALIADASIIVEAGESSGTLSQGWEALRLGRPLFIWHSVFENTELDWPHKFVEYGAVKFSNLDMIMEELPSGDFPNALPLL